MINKNLLNINYLLNYNNSLIKTKEKDKYYIFVDDSKLSKYLTKFKFIKLISNKQINNCEKRDIIDSIILCDLFILDHINEKINYIILLNKDILSRNYDKLLGNNFPGYYKNYNEIDENLLYLYNRKINNYKFYFNFTQKKKVLFVSNDITWNSYCGNTIWASNFIKILSKKNNIDFDIVISAKLNKILKTDNIFVEELKNCNFINLFKKYKKSNDGCMTQVNRKVLISYINNVIKNYDFFILRDHHIMRGLYNLLNNESKKKLIYIQLHRESNIRHLNKIKKINMTLIEYFINKKKNIESYIIPPLLYDKPFLHNNENIYDYCYVGTFHKNSGIEDLCEYFSKSNKKVIFGGKLLVNHKKNIDKIKKKYKKFDNIKFQISINGLEKEECDKIILSSNFCIRIDKITEVLSSKILTYINFEKPIILQRTKTHELLLGKDYPLFFPSKNIIKVKDISLLMNKKINLNDVINTIKNAKDKLDPDKLILNNYRL